MELRHLRYFVALAEELNFTRAAKKLRLAQPSLTRQIHNLEEELRVRLLDRTRNGVSLTGHGRFFLTDARRLVELSNESVKAVRQFNGGDSARLAIGYLSRFDSNLLPSTLAAFYEACPGVAVELFNMSPAEQLRALKARTIDIGFVGLHPAGFTGSTASLHWEPVVQHKVMAVLPASRPWTRKARIQLADLESQAFVSASEQWHPGWRQWLSGLCAQAGFVPRIIQEVDSECGLLSFVAEGLGVTLSCNRLKSMSHHGVVFRPVTPPATAEYWMAWRRENHSKAIGRFVRIVKERSARR